MSAQFRNPAELYEQFYGPAMFQPLAEVLVRSIAIYFQSFRRKAVSTAVAEV